MTDGEIPIRVRDSVASDVPEIARIYSHWVRYGLASFETDPPDGWTIARRRSATLDGGYPYLVAENNTGDIHGFAYLTPYRTRPAYRFACEDSIYVSPSAMHHGTGRSLLAALIERAEAADLRLMIAVIGDRGNAASIGLHAALGFRHSGLLPAIGWKHGRWVDSVLMTRPLGRGATSPPRDSANARDQT